MDCEKTGALIRELRLKQGLTQLKLAEQLHISDRTVSKWETGMGCPDVSLLSSLAAALDTRVENLLAGTLAANGADHGNMKKLKFYRCADCGNILTATGEASISCCGKPLAPLVAQPMDADHAVTVTPVEDEEYLTFTHPMKKDHYLCFAALVGYSRVVLERFYPEQAGELRLPRVPGGKLYLCCSKDGLFVQK